MCCCCLLVVACLVPCFSFFVSRFFNLVSCNCVLSYFVYVVADCVVFVVCVFLLFDVCWLLFVVSRLSRVLSWFVVRCLLLVGSLLCVVGSLFVVCSSLVGVR